MHIDQILRETAPASVSVDERIQALRSDVIAQFTEGGASSLPRRRTRHVNRAVLGTATATLIGVGGVAYATGLVPSFISDQLDRTSPSEVSNIHQVGSFKLQVGSTDRQFEIWRGTNTKGQSCTSVYQSTIPDGNEFGGNCGDYPTDAWFDTTSQSYSGTIDATPPPSTYFAYGEPKIAGVTRVRVTGAQFEHTVPLDPATGGFAVALPEVTTEGSVSGPFANVEFLSQDGTVLGSRELVEK
jgi:hypothetical protein